MPLTFTLDLEDHRVDQSKPSRLLGIIPLILDFLDERDILGTFFIVGNVARREPQLIQKISTAGHEIAYHSRDHVALDYEKPATMLANAREDKAFLEDLTGKSVVGYRAPVFSLTKKTEWVTGIIKETGFVYSSSVLPAPNPLYGYPGTPFNPFRWPNGLIELPVPLHNLLGFSLPYLGGVYLRYLPSTISLRWARLNAFNSFQWIYCHPYDFDPDEPFTQIKGANLITSILLWFNRRNTLVKIGNLMADKSEAPLCQRIKDKNFLNKLSDFRGV